MKNNYNVEKAKKELKKFRKTLKYNVKDEDLDFDLRKNKSKLK